MQQSMITGIQGYFIYGNFTYTGKTVHGKLLDGDRQGTDVSKEPVTEDYVMNGNG